MCSYVCMHTVTCLYDTPDDKNMFQLHIGLCLLHLSQLTECPQAKLSEADKPETVSCVDSIVDDSDIVG